MQNERLTAKEAMELMEELNRYPVGSIYPMTRNDKYAISFYYEGLDGKKKRKTCTGESKDMLLMLRTTFLTNLFYEKLALRKKEENIELLKEAFPKSLLKATAQCEYTVNEAVDGYLAFHKQEVKFKTYESEVYYAKHIKKWLGDKKIGDLKGIDYQYLLNHAAKGQDGGL